LYDLGESKGISGRGIKKGFQMRIGKKIRIYEIKPKSIPVPTKAPPLPTPEPQKVPEKVSQ